MLESLSFYRDPIHLDLHSVVILSICNMSQDMVGCGKATKLSILVSHQGSSQEAELPGFVIWISFMQSWDLVKPLMEGCCICV